MTIMESEDSGDQNQSRYLNGDVTMPSDREERGTDTDEESSMLEQDINNVILLMEAHNLEKENLISCPTPPTTGFLGVLRYKRESQDQASDPRNILPEPQLTRDLPVLCEYCGETARPPLDPVIPEDPALFCCAQYQELCEMLTHGRWLAPQRTYPEEDGTLPIDNQKTREEEEEQAKAREREQHRKQEHERKRLYQDIPPTLPSVDTYSSFYKTISYQLTTWTPDDAQWTDPQSPEIEQEVTKEEKDPLCYPAFEFGMPPRQEGAAFLEKYYTCGRKFLTVFPDGSAQVFYPSGSLALIVVSDEGRKICIVYDDDHSHGRPIRALFHSDGRATCYHSNGNIRLSLDASGGQCLNEAGARTMRWYWRGQNQTPTTLRPIFLSLNRSLGVRVLGQGHVFVSFLASGKQAKFNVGSCVPTAAPGMSKAPERSVSKEELFLLAGRIGAHRVIRHLHQCLSTPSNTRPRRDGLTPRLVSLAKKLLNLSRSLRFEDRERAFVHRCLQDCL
ncbi:hypothetical protein UPYG_G00297570 [Umbra pygmaea]|uniref:FAM194 C-terminal domain-containing protein n=1 Tax=Umbra pygmaea TaxID=75934 RepID=A0ABD0WA43_UMBPY